MVDETDLEAALASHCEQRGNLDQMRADYNSSILHPGTVRIAGDRARAVSSCRRTQNRPQEEGTTRIPTAEITGFYGALIKKFRARVFGSGIPWPGH